MSDVAAKPKAGSRLFGKITDENVDAVVRDVSNAWYAVAAIQGVVIGAMVALGTTQGGDLMDPVVCALGGYYMRSRKSRALAVALFLYSLALAASTVANILGHAKGGTNLFLSAILVVIGLRGIMATWIVQRRGVARIRWGRVIGVTLLAAVVDCVIFVIAAVALNVAASSGTKLNPSLVNLIYTVVVTLPAIFTIAAFTAKWPLADHTEPVARVFG